jgi:hypothetical protein
MEVRSPEFFGIKKSGVFAILMGCGVFFIRLDAGRKYGVGKVWGVGYAFGQFFKGS